MAYDDEIIVETWDDDGFIELTEEEKRFITPSKPILIEEITDDVKTKEPEEPYTKRGNKKYYKTNENYYQTNETATEKLKQALSNFEASI